MAFRLTTRRGWVVCLVGIIAAGILSRIVHSGFVILDKYLGDALYAAMVYAILRLVWREAALGWTAMGVMTALELFQVTGIPAQLLASEYLAVRICARLMGTGFSILDLAAYGFGILCIYFAEMRGRRGTTSPACK